MPIVGLSQPSACAEFCINDSSCIAFAYNPNIKEPSFNCTLYKGDPSANGHFSYTIEIGH